MIILIIICNRCSLSLNVIVISLIYSWMFYMDMKTNIWLISILHWNYIYLLWLYELWLLTYNCLPFIALFLTSVSKSWTGSIFPKIGLPTSFKTLFDSVLVVDFVPWLFSMLFKELASCSGPCRLFWCYKLN